MIWVLFAVMTVAAGAVALWPLARVRSRAARPSSEAEFYRAQLAEIERDVERGVLPQAEAAAARAEAGRRLLALTGTVEGGPVAPASQSRRIGAAALAAALIVAVGAGLYGWLGNPGMADAPLASRQQAPQADDSVALAIAHVEAEAKANPDDLKAWAALAPVYMRMGRYPDAIAAFRQVLRLQGEDGEIRADLGEAEVAAAQGQVTPEARADFEKALTSTPASPIARYYLALADEQAGDTAKAIATYQELIVATADHPEWQQIIRAHLATLKGEKPPAAAAQGDQQDAIGAMVSRLADRLAKQGGSADEWMRLVRAYSVLAETDKFNEALASARKALAADPDALAKLDAMAQTLGQAKDQNATPPAAAPAAAAEGSQPDMIGAMVSRLADRLAKQGGSADEWTQLVRAYSVLNQTDKANEALASARKALAADSDALGKLNGFADTLGLAKP